MSLVASLLQAVVSLDGEALVIHVGEKPYVVTTKGQVELATRALSLEAVSGIVEQLLPIDSQRALEEFGAAQYQIPLRSDWPQEHFEVVAARGGNDVWMEIRRRRGHDDDAVPVEMFAAAPPEPTVDSGRHEDIALPDALELWPPDEGAVSDLALAPEPRLESKPEPKLELKPEPKPELKPAPKIEAKVETPVPQKVEQVEPKGEVKPAAAAPAELKVARPMPVPAPPPQPAVVLPLSRNPVRSDLPPPIATATGLDRLLRIAAARGASTLYLASEARPSVRVDGEIQMLDGEPPLRHSDVESLLLDLMPERNREALRSGMETEWLCDVAEVGRVRCMTFRDHRGAGGIFRMLPARAVTADQLGLSREIQALAAEPEGLVLVAGPRSSGKSTLVSAFVDLINRTRHEHVVTIESEIKVIHDLRSSLISQREVRGNSDELLAAMHAAIREDPDVLVVEAREAYRRAADRPAFVALLKRQGVDTSFVERPA